MAKTRTRAVSLSPDDAVDSMGFVEGTTTVTSARFYKGYGPEHKSPELFTLRLEHIPKATGDTEVEYLSCGKKASTNFTIGKEGKILKPKAGVIGMQTSCNAMVFLTSLAEVGFPKNRLKKGDVSQLDGITIKGKQKPSSYQGGLTDEAAGKPRTTLVAVKLIRTPWDRDEGEETGVQETVSAGDSDEDDNEDENEEEEEEEEEDEGEGDDESDEDSPDVSDTVVAAHLQAVLDSAGGSLKRAKLTPVGFQVLKTVPGRNDIVARMVDPAFLKKETGWTFNEKTGKVALAEDED